MSSATLPVIRLKKREERRLRAGHLWVFSNEVDVAATPLNVLEPGQAVVVADARGKALGAAYANPHSLICARLVSGNPAKPLSESLIERRLGLALALRERLYDAPFYRLAYGESDRLPGLVVDRYGDHLVVQITTAGMELFRGEIVAVLKRLLNPGSILLRNDVEVRAMEQLPMYREAALGEPPAEVTVREHGCRFTVALEGGQKTGWYFDQRDNRGRFAPLCAGRRVLDVFSYVGAWGVQAACAGAGEVVCVDESGAATGRVLANAGINDVASKVQARTGDAFAVLRALREEGERFDVIVLDPPAFIKRRRDAKAGLQAYRRINELAVRLLAADGILVSCSCSWHLGREELQRQVHGATRSQGRPLQILAFGGQSADHPVHPAIPETGYLKSIFARVL